MPETRRLTFPAPGLPGSRVLPLVFLGALVANLASAGTIRLQVQPAAIELHGPDDEHGVLVTAFNEQGQGFDVTDRSFFRSKGPQVAQVNSNGLCRGVADGETEMEISFLGRQIKVPIRIGDTQKIAPPSFRQDIIPILTKAGCNSGACHGKMAGQNNFRLSLRGYAPEWDHEWLTSEFNSRRIDFSHPEDSLMLLKPAGRVLHEGHQRFTESSRSYRVLRDWIAARGPGPDTNEVDAARLEVLPGDRMLRIGDTQQLLVRAHYPDGRVRDVTWLAQFVSNDENTARVSADGKVKSVRSGETSVRVHFQGQVEVITLTTPYANSVRPEMFARAHNALDPPVFQKLQQLRIPPSEPADDLTFLRRAFLDAIGTLPSVEETRSFLGSSAADKRPKMIDQLLQRPEFVDFWALQLSDLLQNRKERDHDVRGSKGVRAFHEWLRGQVAQNRPWDKLVKDVLLASGDCGAKPQIGYFVTLVGEKKAEESELADSVAQAFLGTRIGCAKCHNHPLEKFTQDDYYHFAAFFSRLSLKREDPMKGTTSLASVSREEQDQEKRIAEITKAFQGAELAAKSNTGEAGAKEKTRMTDETRKLDEAKKQLVRLRQESKVGVRQPRTKQFMGPQPLDRTPVKLGPGEDPREQLAAWITSPGNKNFSGAMMNRLWKHFFGTGLVEQVDDLRASNPPSNPNLWKALNREFVSSGYDLKHVMRLILNSRTYQLSSTTLPGNETDQRFYSHYYARRLPAEVLADAISTATDVPDQFAGYPTGLRAIQLPEPGISSYFLGLFGRSERVTACACERKGEVTLPQLLHINNGEEVAKKIRSNDGRVSRICKEEPDDRAVETIFLATLNRPPNRSETAAVKSLLVKASTRDEVYQDLFWALLNTKEFAFNH